MVALAKPDNLILLSSKSNEWYTPRQYVDAARSLMNGIELDPASCQLANATVKAERYYTKTDNGLAQEWKTRSLWLNPPYGFTDGKSNQGLWVKRLISEYERCNVLEAVLLVNAVTDRTWFHLLWQYAICFTDHRIEFYAPTDRTPAPTHGNALVYFGKNEQKFIKRFSRFGAIIPANAAIREQEITPLSLWEVQP